jgi:hypothetical protein
MMGLTHVLQALGRRPALTKLTLHGICLDSDEARQLGMAVCHTPSLQSLDLARNDLGSSAGLAAGFWPWRRVYRDHNVATL